MQPLGDLQDAFTELNINIPTEEEEYLLPEWKDITSFVDEATQEFKVGQLVHLQSFTLFDAMSAIEIMDPRMDTGMLVKEKPNTFDIQNRISIEETLGIMDRLLTREMAWISGHSLSQTVYTCIYFHHIATLNLLPMPTLTSSMDDIIYGVLKTYVLATVKCCHYIWTEMTQGNVFEEEDFTTNLFGLSFNDQHPDVAVFNDIDSSVMLLNHLLNTDLSEEQSKIIKEILNRIEIRKSFLLSLVFFSQVEGTHLSKADKELTKVISLLQDIDLSLGKDIPEAFDPNVNRKLTSQTPPRPVELVSPEQSYKEFGLLIGRLASICTVVDFPSVTSLMNYFLSFASTQPYPDAFSRSKLNTLFFHNQRVFGTLQVSKLILSSIQETVRPPAWWLSANQKIPAGISGQEFLNAHEALKTYLDRITMVFIEYFRINCHNRSRQRRMLCKVIAEWEILQEEAAGVDEVFHSLQKDENQNPISTPYYFSSWAYNIKLTMIEKILYLGFELDLYGDHEYIMIYWYIQCVLGSRDYLLERISNYIDTTSTGKNIYGYLMTNQRLNQAKKSLSEAILKILLCAENSGQWNQRQVIFDNEETRYLQRFKPFKNLISPPHPSYETFLSTIEIDDFDIDMMKTIITNDLDEAKKMLDSLLTMSAEETNTEMCRERFVEDVKNCIRTVVANKIGLMNIDQSKVESVQAIFKYHPWFPMITKK
ncbi:Mak10 subunit, NatC N-terminal acetyltransferase-domain-containing protein [Helicostylum pulchrum]|nr:Mak10 subunit, NatC N-terminal acetyltransferase-domain-containing protein [Helicostylum pulchrum]